MFTYETADQKEVRRFRIAQFNGRMATVTAGEATVTGFRAFGAGAGIEHTAPLDDHHHSQRAEGRAQAAAALVARTSVR
ncbi:hypothetical protein ACVWZZ_004755 [Bradyrhizobium sp. LM6.10]